MGVNTFAEVVTTRKITPKQSANTPVTVRPINKLSENIKMCKPYSESLDSNIGGIDFNFKVKISGWVNNKCRLDFVAQSTGINNMFKDLYGVNASDATIMTFEPKIRCDFTKQQLQYVGDSILQEQERTSGNGGKMLKNPNDIVIPMLGTFSESDSRLMNVLLNDNACKILNTGDSSGIFESVFSF